MTRGGAFSNSEHLWTLSEKQRDGKKDWDVAHESRIKSLLSDVKVTDKPLFLRSKSTSAWMIVRGTTALGIVLSTTESRYFYVLVIKSLP